MGVGASISAARAENDAISSRSVNAKGNANSVRAMALKNHARQENSYIPQDQLRSKLNKSLRVADKVEYGTKEKKGVSYSSRAARSFSNSANALVAEKPTVSSSPSKNAAGAAAVGGGEGGGMGSLVQFKAAMSLNLKISLEDESDWRKVGIVGCLPLTN